jgi:hypothetical protein
MPPAWMVEEKTRKEATPRLQQTDDLSWTTGSTVSPWARSCATRLLFCGTTLGDEYMAAVRALWSLWDLGAIIADRATGALSTREVHHFDFEGNWFKIRGPLTAGSARKPAGHRTSSLRRVVLSGSACRCRPSLTWPNPRGFPGVARKSRDDSLEPGRPGRSTHTPTTAK